MTNYLASILGLAVWATPIDRLPTSLTVGNNQITVQAYLWEDRMPRLAPHSPKLHGFVDIKTTASPVPLTVKNIWIVQSPRIRRRTKFIPEGVLRFRLTEIPPLTTNQPTGVVVELSLDNGKTAHLRSALRPIEITY